MLSARAKRVLVYTSSLLIAPMPVMPFEKGTREFALSLIACGTVLALSSFYVVQGEIRIKPRMLVGTKLLISAFFTLLFGIGMLIGSLVYLIRGD